MPKMKPTKPEPETTPEAPIAPAEAKAKEQPKFKLHPNGKPYVNWPGDSSDTRRGLGIVMD